MSFSEGLWRALESLDAWLIFAFTFLGISVHSYLIGAEVYGFALSLAIFCLLMRAIE